MKPATQSLDDDGGRFIFDFSAFAPTEDITLELVGRLRTHTCLVERSVWRRSAEPASGQTCRWDLAALFA